MSQKSTYDKKKDTSSFGRSNFLLQTHNEILKMKVAAEFSLSVFASSFGLMVWDIVPLLIDNRLAMYNNHVPLSETQKPSLLCHCQTCS